MQWNHHGQIDFIFHTTDAVRNLTADVQCGGYRGSGTFQRKSGARSGGFDNGTDQCVYQSFHRNLIGSKCTCSEILCGRKKTKEMSETVHTAIALALVSGVVMAVIGVVFARGALEIMGTPDDVIAKSTLYMRIYFCGMPFFMMYNYGAAILRAVGDTKRPLIFLIVSGVINAVLNLFLVIAFHLDVAGVGIATVISQLVSCILVLRCLHHTESSYQLHLAKLRIRSVYLKQIF